MIDGTDRQRLIALGAEKSGEWIWEGSRARLKGEAPEKPGVYAFLLDTEVRHLGYSKSNVAQRLHRYEVTTAEGTARRVRDLMTKNLQAGYKIEVLTIECAAKAVNELKWCLIREFGPSWNG